MTVSAAPAWFDQTMAQAPERLTIDVEGASIEVLVWGEVGRPGLLFIHGIWAQAEWWSFIAPWLASGHRCAALSMSGMGRSGQRDRYSTRQYAREVIAVIAAAGLDRASEPPILIAHSFGGIVASRCVETEGDRLGGAILVDRPVRPWDPNWTSPVRGPSRPRIYADAHEALSRFRLDPLQLCANPFLIDHVVRTGLRPADEGGVTWAYDPRLADKLSDEGQQSHLGPTDCPVAFIWGERSSVMDPAVVAHMHRTYPEVPKVLIADAAHHVMLDQPLALVAALRALLATWPGRQAD